MVDNRKKPYFQSRSVSEIRDLSLRDLNPLKSGLVKAIDELDSSHGLVLGGSVLPREFFKGRGNPARKAYKHGNYVALEQPRTLEESFRFKSPLRMRQDAVKRMSYRVETNMDFIGYKFHPVNGRDRRERFVPFIWIAEGAKLFCYACQNTEDGIKVKIYNNSQRAKIEGAGVVLSVPSRTSGNPRYEFRANHVPITFDKGNLATILRFNSSAPVEDSGKRHQMPHKDHDIRYTYEDSLEESDRIVFGPHDIAGYFGIIKNIVDENRASGNRTLMPVFDMCPFVIPSKHQMEFYKRLENNVLVHDEYLSGKSKLRALNLAEKCILLGRALAVFGNQDFAYNEPKKRDGKLKKYDSWNWD